MNNRILVVNSLQLMITLLPLFFYHGATAVVGQGLLIVEDS